MYYSFQEKRTVDIFENIDTLVMGSQLANSLGLGKPDVAKREMNGKKYWFFAYKSSKLKDIVKVKPYDNWTQGRMYVGGRTLGYRIEGNSLFLTS